MKNELHDFIKKLSATTLNVSMAILILMPQGWAVIAAILSLEVALFYFFLKREYEFKKLFWRLAISNLVSGISGFVLSLFLNGGWLGVFWFPWVGSHEIQFMSRFFILYFLIIFVIKLFLEIPVKIIFFRKLRINNKKNFFIENFLI